MALVAMLPLLAACSDDDPAPSANNGKSASVSGVFLCDNLAIESRCFDYWQGATRADVGGTCDGVVTETACSGTVVGRCAVALTNEPNKGKTITAAYYAEGPSPWTTATAEANCTELKGAFSR
jgi:hypothetical protein